MERTGGSPAGLYGDRGGIRRIFSGYIYERLFPWIYARPFDFSRRSVSKFSPVPEIECLQYRGESRYPKAGMIRLIDVFPATALESSG